ncbi:hypothetical protein Sbal223_1635 [Shewanella baltica OS223]|nr:hypothetical protein Sbal223_1635 [Shewanella baltica OS223]
MFTQRKCNTVLNTQECDLPTLPIDDWQGHIRYDKCQC